MLKLSKKFGDGQKILKTLLALILVLGTLGQVACKRSPNSSENKGKDDKKLSGKFKKNQPVEDITKEERAEARTLRLAQDPTEYERSIFKSEVRNLFEVEDFKSLEALANDLARTKARFPDGSWKLTAFYSGLEDRFNTTDAGYSTDAEMHENWRNKYPNSPVQLTAFANLLANYAWKARGSGYSNAVTPDMGEKMQERLAAARKNLQLAVETSKEDIHWYKVALRIGLGQSYSKKDFDSIVEVAMEKEPNYDVIYHDRAYSLLPQWYGKKGEMEKFAGNIADKLNNAEDGRGDEVYASITTDIYDFYDDIFKETSMDWDRVKKGLKISMEKYPNALTLKNHAAYLATLARDRDFAKECFDQLRNSYVKWVWNKPERFVHFRTWAKTGKW